MTTFQPELEPPKRDHQFITVGVVVAILLVALLALPFLTRSRSHRQTISSVHTTSNTARAISR